MSLDPQLATALRASIEATAAAAKARDDTNPPQPPTGLAAYADQPWPYTRADDRPSLRELADRP